MQSTSRIAALSMSLISLLALTGCNSGDDCLNCNATVEAPALINDAAKRPDQTNDFLRLIFLFPNQQFSGMLGQPSAVYAFVGPTGFYQPPLPISQVPPYPGLTYRADKTLYAIRCQPRASAALEPLLATWPNVYALLKTDLGNSGYTCPALPGLGKMRCTASSRTIRILRPQSRLTASTRRWKSRCNCSPILTLSTS